MAGRDQVQATQQSPTDDVTPDYNTGASPEIPQAPQQSSEGTVTGDASLDYAPKPPEEHTKPQEDLGETAVESEADQTDETTRQAVDASKKVVKGPPNQDY